MRAGWSIQFYFKHSQQCIDNSLLGFEDVLESQFIPAELQMFSTGLEFCAHLGWQAELMLIFSGMMSASGH